MAHHSSVRVCELCKLNKPMIKRHTDGVKACKTCFIRAFEDDVHNTIVSTGIFKRGDHVAVAASGGKDSTVLAFLLATLNERHDYGVRLTLLAIDEGITGYRDDSLETVKENQSSLGLQLRIVSYKELYGYSMDEVVRVTGKRNNCTYCGVFRRQALDRGARLIGADLIATGHNADDIAETVLMNLLRGDIARLGRCTAISSRPASSSAAPVHHGAMPRVKPLKYCFEKEIVLYAHARKLAYHSTECIYSPNAYRGFAREWIKDLESLRPAALLDILRAAEGWRVDEGTPAGLDLSTVEEDGGLPSAAGGCGGDGGGGEGGSVASSVSGRSSKLVTRARVQRPCSRCGFMASSELCQACSLLASLAAGAPRVALTTARHARKLYGEGVDRGALPHTQDAQGGGRGRGGLLADAADAMDHCSASAGDTPGPSDATARKRDVTSCSNGSCCAGTGTCVRGKDLQPVDTGAGGHACPPRAACQDGPGCAGAGHCSEG